MWEEEVKKICTTYHTEFGQCEQNAVGFKYKICITAKSQVQVAVFQEGLQRKLGHSLLSCRPASLSNCIQGV